MLGALVGLSLVGTIHGGPYMSYLLMVPIVIAFGALQGVFVEWIGVRPAIKIKSEFGWIMSTIALAIIFKNVAETSGDKDAMTFRSPPQRRTVQGAGRERAADAGGRHRRRAGHHAGRRAVQPQVDLWQGGGGDGK